VSFKTTHTGSLPRPDYLLELMFAREGGEGVDAATLDEAIERATAHVIARQKQAGVSVVNDGEMSKPSYATYIKHRLSGFGGEAGQYEFEDLEQFPGAKAQVFGNRGRAKRSAPACTAPIEVIDMDAPREDAERLNRRRRTRDLHVRRFARRDRPVLSQPVLQERRGIRLRPRRRLAPRIRDHRQRRHYPAG
jgi:5-methyltetrahydropteroyltriglutamate--homocysteine methyltransferase